MCPSEKAALRSTAKAIERRRTRNGPKEKKQERHFAIQSPGKARTNKRHDKKTRSTNTPRETGQAEPPALPLRPMPRSRGGSLLGLCLEQRGGGHDSAQGNSLHELGIRDRNRHHLRSHVHDPASALHRRDLDPTDRPSRRSHRGSKRLPFRAHDGRIHESSPHHWPRMGGRKFGISLAIPSRSRDWRLDRLGHPQGDTAEGSRLRLTYTHFPAAVLG